jgi:hypothetical protein
MIIARRMLIIASVVAYGCNALFLTTTPALASRHRHHEQLSSHRSHSRHEDVASRSLSRRERRELTEREAHENAREDRRDDFASREDRRHEARIELAAAPTMTRRERKHLEQLQRLQKLADIREYGSLRRAHLYRLYLAENERKWAHKEAAAQYERHLQRVEMFRRERLAEMNGDVSSKSIRAWQTYVANVPIRLITVDLNDPGVKVNALLAQNGIGSAEPFGSMIRRSQPDVAVTGTFFSLNNLHPVGDIVINGDLAYFGGMGTALCITPDNKADMITVTWGHHHDWSGYSFVMACGPRLLNGGQVVLDPAAERFRDKHMLNKNSRIGVGITPGNKLVFVMTNKPIFLGRLAKIMRAIGCVQAMNLDAGSSTGLYCDGNMMARPGRWLTNAIVVYANQHTVQAAT